jgi:succinyl-CoA synthetase beta subunit
VRLYEHEAKALIAAGGVAVPAGAMWPDAAATNLAFPVAVKAQLPEGGRGKRGGVRFTSSAGELERAVHELQGGSAELPAAEAVLVEERLDVERELYVAVLVDRRSPSGVSLLAAAEGGVDVEQRAGGELLRVPLSPGSERLPSFAVRDVAALWRLPVEPVEEVLAALWVAFRTHDCLLLEVNPLACLPGGRLVALDARAEVDDDARFRHGDWPSRAEGTPFEAGCRRLGVVASELAGDIAVMTSGAGLGMATLDLVTRAGGRAACVIDLGGVVFRPGGIVRHVVELVGARRPRALLVNCFLQLAELEPLAHELAAGMRAAPPMQVVVRAAGRGAVAGRSILEEAGAEVMVELAAACRRAAEGRSPDAVGAA